MLLSLGDVIETDPAQILHGPLVFLHGTGFDPTG